MGAARAAAASSRQWLRTRLDRARSSSVAPSGLRISRRGAGARARSGGPGCDWLPPVDTVSHTVGGGGHHPHSGEKNGPGGARLQQGAVRPREDPLRVVAEAEVPSRLSSVRGWRTVGQEACREAGVEALVESVVPPPEDPTVGRLVCSHLRPGDRRAVTTRRQRREERRGSSLPPGVPSPVRHLGVDRRLGGEQGEERWGRSLHRVARRLQLRDPGTCSPSVGRSFGHRGGRHDQIVEPLPLLPLHWLVETATAAGATFQNRKTAVLLSHVFYVYGEVLDLPFR